jgi:hypothetical protein
MAKGLDHRHRGPYFAMDSLDRLWNETSIPAKFHFLRQFVLFGSCGDNQLLTEARHAKKSFSSKAHCQTRARIDIFKTVNFGGRIASCEVRSRRHWDSATIVGDFDNVESLTKQSNWKMNESMNDDE